MPDVDAWTGVKLLAREPCQRYPGDPGRDCLQDRERGLDPDSDCSVAFRSQVVTDTYACLSCQARLTVVAEPEPISEPLGGRYEIRFPRHSEAPE